MGRSARRLARPAGSGPGAVPAPRARRFLTLALVIGAASIGCGPADEGATPVAGGGTGGAAEGPASGTAAASAASGPPSRAEVEALVRSHARAWETGDTALVRRIVHEDALLAYPRRRVDRETWVRELADFARVQEDTRIYLHGTIVDGSAFAVEWQFATTDRATGIRTAVSDAIIGRVEDGRIVLWKEYLDGRVPEGQRAGTLPLDEGEEPFPWPRVPQAAGERDCDARGEGPGDGDRHREEAHEKDDDRDRDATLTREVRP